jgi:hypothetical protein
MIPLEKEIRRLQRPQPWSSVSRLQPIRRDASSVLRDLENNRKPHVFGEKIVGPSTEYKYIVFICYVNGE